MSASDFHRHVAAQRARAMLSAYFRVPDDFMTKAEWEASTTPAEREEIRAEAAARLEAEREALVPLAERPTYEPDELLRFLRLSLSERTALAEASHIAAEGRVEGPLFGVGAPRAGARASGPQRLSDLGDLVAPPAERFLWGKAVPLGKSTVLYGPGGVGKSAWMAQLVYAVAGYERTLHGFPCWVVKRVRLALATRLRNPALRKSSRAA